MTQVVQAYTWCTSWSAETEHACQLDEYGADARAIGCPSHGRDEKVLAHRTELGPNCQIRFQSLPRRRLKREKPLFAELSISDDQAIIDQVVTLQGERLRNPKA
jgi:hypothetical protein